MHLFKSSIYFPFLPVNNALAILKIYFGEGAVSSESSFGAGVKNLLWTHSKSIPLDLKRWLDLGLLRIRHLTFTLCIAAVPNGRKYSTNVCGSKNTLRQSPFHRSQSIHGPLRTLALPPAYKLSPILPPLLNPWCHDLCYSFLVSWCHHHFSFLKTHWDFCLRHSP